MTTQYIALDLITYCHGCWCQCCRLAIWRIVHSCTLLALCSMSSNIIIIIINLILSLMYILVLDPWPCSRFSSYHTVRMRAVAGTKNGPPLAKIAEQRHVSLTLPPSQSLSDGPERSFDFVMMSFWRAPWTLVVYWLIPWWSKKLSRPFSEYISYKQKV